jgi:hypothetical protein
MKAEQETVAFLIYIDAHKQFRMEDLPMKKLMLLSLIVAFALLGTQAFASPPIKPPVEGFIIEKSINVILDPGLDGKSSFSESESFNWTYYEGWGKGPFYPNGYVPSPAHFGSSWDYCTTQGCPQTDTRGLVGELGFTEGAEIAYEQTFEAKTGHLEFNKTFVAKSDPEAGDDNLVVNKKIEFQAADPTVDYAKHMEKVGLSVISMGSGPSTVSNPASGLLSLCPWAASGETSATGGAYPPTNEAIAAGSSFQVSSIVGFESTSKVNSSINPALSYKLDVIQGVGTISTGFIVDLWEGPAGYVWDPLPLWYQPDPEDPAVIPNVCIEAYPCYCDPKLWKAQGGSYGEWVAAGSPMPGVQVWQLPQYAYGEPPLASRTHYEEKTTATGTWVFNWAVSYESTIPSVSAPASAFPFNNVP